MRMFFLVAVFMVSNFLPASEVNISRNSLKDIEGKKEKIVLKLIRTWGDEDSSNSDEMFFKAPSGIAVDNKNNVYIADSKLNCIKVFDADGSFIRQIGARGQGPGDLIYPRDIAIDKKMNLWVNDFGNRRIQIFSLQGKCIKVFKLTVRPPSKIILPAINRMAYIDFKGAKNGTGLIQIVDTDGNKVKSLGMNILPPIVNLPFRGGKYDSSIASYCNKSRRYFVAYHYSQMIQVFNHQFEMEQVIFYDTPMNVLTLKWQSKRNNFDITEKQDHYAQCDGVGINKEGLIFLTSTIRKPLKNESFIHVNNMARPAMKNYAKKTDMYRLFVFNTDGKIKASKQLDVHCTDIFLHEDYIFIIDQIFNGFIYQYRYSFIGDV